MLSPPEDSGLRDILQDIEDEGVFSILKTVTNGMFATENRQEAVENILSYTGRPFDLLKRKKVRKEILFEYLRKSGIYVLEGGKLAMIKKCLEIWGSRDVCEDSDNVADVKEIVHLDTGIEFVKSFFKLLNTLDGVGPEHFWSYCALSASGHTNASFSGAHDVANYLAKLIQIDKYYFHPHEKSIDAEIEEHGLVKVFIHGILHQDSNYVGRFDSAFGLVKDPYCPDTYKIQLVKLKMELDPTVQRALPVNNYPTICQTSH